MNYSKPHNALLSHYMKRVDIIQTIGKEYLSSNIENDEFRYPKAYEQNHLLFEDVRVSGSSRSYENLDLRFVDKDRKVAVLVETKQNFDKDPNAERQLDAYMLYESKLTGYAIIGILANTNDDRIRVWKTRVNEENFLKNHLKLKSFIEYANFLRPKYINDKEKVIKNTYDLNEKLHTYSIPEALRSQFVGTCLLALKNNLKYDSDFKTSQIIAGIREILQMKLSKDLRKDYKITILDQKVLGSQYVRDLKPKVFISILNDIKTKILPHINDESTMGQDLLNLFFTTFNKYVGKADKNQAFTPDHIVHFMCKVVGINRHSRVLDPCCGSGAFLVRAMTEALADCQTNDERKKVYEHIYGIEYEENAFGLATTNMLIHDDGNSNIVQGSCFKLDEWIKEANVNVVLMNPPYNAQRAHCKESYVKTWKKDKKGKEKKEDPSKGFHYVYHIAQLISTGKLAVLLPMQCAIGTDTEIKKFKELMLQEHHLDAVFSLPPDIFHPGANANACCMIFDLGIRHESVNDGTFFGYFKDDGFRKKKNLGRIEQINPETGLGLWSEIENLWLDTYRNRKVVKGLSAIKKVTYTDEWLCEAYMKTDYSKLTVDDFEQTIRDFFAYCISSGSESYGRD